MAQYWLDYSAAKLSGATIKAAGYTGVIRYIDSPSRLGTKHTNMNEYTDHVRNGLQVQLVMQTTTSASDGGWTIGVEHAQRALAGANYLGYDGPIYFTNDRTTVPNPAAWRAYLDGAASVIGKARTGAYGFFNAMDLAIGHASFFWQAGRRSDVRAHTHVWQDNNTQVTVGGITCDRNLILKEMGKTEVDELSWSDKSGVRSANDPTYEYSYGELVVGSNVKDNENYQTLGRIEQKLTEGLPAAIDYDLLATKVAPQVAAHIASSLATAVADELDRRARDGDPKTGPVS